MKEKWVILGDDEDAAAVNVNGPWRQGWPWTLAI